MNTLAESIGRWLADYYLLFTILLAAVLIAMQVMRQPARKLALTRASVAGLLLLAVLCALPDWSPVHLTEPSPASASVESVAAEPAAATAMAAEPAPVLTGAISPATESAVIASEASAPTEAARWAEELGGVYRRMAQSGLAKELSLVRARDMYGIAVEHLDSVEGDRSPDVYDRLILALNSRGSVSDEIYRVSGDRQDLRRRWR